MRACGVWGGGRTRGDITISASVFNPANSALLALHSPCLALPRLASPRSQGIYTLEVFFEAKYPTEYPKARFATKIGNPHVDELGRINFPTPPPLDNPCLAKLIFHIREVILMAKIADKELWEKAVHYNSCYGQQNGYEDELYLDNPMRNWAPGRVSEILGVTEKDFVDYKEFYQFSEFQKRSTNVIKGFTPIDEDEDDVTLNPAMRKGKVKGAGSILGKWSKGATVDDDVIDELANLEFNNEEVLYKIKPKRPSPLNYSGHSFLTLSHTVSQSTLSAITKMLGFTNMTCEQCQMLPAVMEGKDILVRSNTGTGKTISFLIPCIERALMSAQTAKSTQISALITSPTRELASQIADMAKQLLYFNKKLTVDIFMGGKNINSEVARCEQAYPNILVVTPGRMLDHLDRNVGQLKQQLAHLDTLVLDESDQLLAAGFLPSIETILSYIPMASNDLQTMMFSATIPPNLHAVVSSTLKSNCYFLDTEKTETKWGLTQFNEKKNTLLSVHNNPPTAAAYANSESAGDAGGEASLQALTDETLLASNNANQKPNVKAKQVSTSR